MSANFLLTFIFQGIKLSISEMKYSHLDLISKTNTRKECDFLWQRSVEIYRSTAIIFFQLSRSGCIQTMTSFIES